MNSTTGHLNLTIVEDNPTYAEALKNAVAPHVASVQILYTGVELLIKLENGPVPDVVFMDIHLPGMNGIVLTRILKERYPSIKVFMITVDDATATVREALLNGADGYLLKSSSIEYILSSITDAMEEGKPIDARLTKQFIDEIIVDEEPAGENPLSEREAEILRLLAQGHSRDQVADQMMISYHTVDYHLRRIYKKLNVQSQTAAIISAIKTNLI